MFRKPGAVHYWHWECIITDNNARFTGHCRLAGVQARFPVLRTQRKKWPMTFYVSELQDVINMDYRASIVIIIIIFFNDKLIIATHYHAIKSRKQLSLGLE